jgi:hypothetical protein
MLHQVHTLVHYYNLLITIADAEKNEPIPDHYDELICSIKDNQKIIE